MTTADFRSKQIQTTKIVASGSTGTGAKLLIYSEESENKSNPNTGGINPVLFNTGSIGTDIFLYVSGTVSSGSSTDRTTVFGGSVTVSGNLVVKGFLSSAYGHLGVEEIVESDTTIGSFNLDHPTNSQIAAKQLLINNASKTLVVSGTNVAVRAKTAGMISGEEPHYSGFNAGQGFSEVVVSGAHAMARTRGVGATSIRNLSVGVTQSLFQMHSTATGSSVMEMHSTSDTGDTLIDIQSYSTGSDSSISVYSIGAGPGSTADATVAATAVGAANTTIGAQSTGNSANLVEVALGITSSNITLLSVATSASIDVSSSGTHFSRIRIKSQTSNVNTTSSIELSAFDVVVSASRSIFHTQASALGRDTSFHVSGAIGTKGVVGGKIAVFGGDLVVSGNFTVVGSSSHDFTGSITSGSGTTVVKTSAVPKYSLAGLIPAATTRSLMVDFSAVGNDAFIEWTAAGHIMSSGSTIYREVIFGFIDNILNSATMRYTGSQGSFFPGVACSMSTSITTGTNKTFFHLINGTGNEYSCAINLGVARFSASNA